MEDINSHDPSDQAAIESASSADMPDMAPTVVSHEEQRRILKAMPNATKLAGNINEDEKKRFQIRQSGEMRRRRIEAGRRYHAARLVASCRLAERNAKDETS